MRSLLVPLTGAVYVPSNFFGQNIGSKESLGR